MAKYQAAIIYTADQKITTLYGASKGNEGVEIHITEDFTDDMIQGLEIIPCSKGVYDYFKMWGTQDGLFKIKDHKLFLYPEVD